MKKALLFLLAAALLCCAVACRTNGGQPASSGTANTDTVVTDGETAPPLAYDQQRPDIDYNGMEYGIGGWIERYKLDILSEEPDESGDFINAATYRQYCAVEDKYSCKVKNYQLEPAQIELAIDGGDSAVSAIVYQMAYFGAEFVLRGYCDDLFRYEQIDTTQPWWNQSAVENLQTFGHLFMGFGDFVANHGITYVHSFFYNIQLAEDNHISGIYETVDNGSWTLDKLEEYSKAVYRDVNGNQERDWDDVYGLGQSVACAGVFRTAFDQPVTERAADGRQEIVIDSEKFVDIVDRVRELCYSTKSVWTSTWAEEGKIMPMFSQNQLLFYNGFLCNADQLREMESDYGILPFPKWDEDQKEYYTPVRGDNYLMAIPISVPAENREFVGNCTEMMAYYGYKYVRPAVYDVLLKEKVARDEEAKRMLDLLCSRITVEWEFCHTNNTSFEFVLVNVLQQNVSWSSYYDRMIQGATLLYDDIMDAYRALG